MRIQTPAKINTLLYILGKREDGFHDLYMHMVPVNLYDTLTFTKNKNQGLKFQIKGASFSDSDEDNLVVKAVRAFEQVSRIKVNYDIFLEKKIPYGAGLGGGSGNAAGTLKALNYIFRNSNESEGLIHPESLNEIALKLGSDVPFFLKPGPAEIRGRGEKLRELSDYPKFNVLIIKPSFAISTLEAYQNCIPKREINFPSIRSFNDLSSQMHNQFESSLLVQYPLLSKLKKLLIENGAFGALVTGSGSAVYGVYNNKDQQYQAYKDLVCLQIGEIFSCETLVIHHYF
jgi:4-diphosphocytidyl-2-C-methyl-D-erythritol kinase